MPHSLLRALPLLSLGCVDYAYQQHYEEDHYTQGTPGSGVDILWVVDNSGTMSEEQDQLVAQFAAFAETLRNSGADYQVGVTTTDVLAQGGALVGEIITPQTGDLAEAFSAQAAQGVRGSRDEQPLQAIVMALDPVVNPGFIRPEAGFQVVVLTDEDDHSDEEVQAYLDAIDAVKSGSIWRISAIAGDEPDGCHSSIADATYGPRVHEAVKATDGELWSICLNDFGPALDALALTASNMATSFALTRIPAPTSITVWVDGVEVHQRDKDGWQYDLGDNAIHFTGLAVPRAGQTIDVKYIELRSSDLLDTAEAG